MAEELSDKRIKNVYKMLGLEYIPKGPNKNIFDRGYEFQKL